MDRDAMSAEVLILGAGPAGLVAGVELHRHGIQPLLLERGAAGESWGRMPANLRLVSPWRANHLTAFQPSRFPAHRAVTARDYHEYLAELALSTKLTLQTGVNIERVSFRSNLFEVETNQGLFRSALVINATGYFSHPFIPSLPGIDDSPIPQTHFAQWASASCQRPPQGSLAGRKVLVIGQRLSAAHLVPELVAAGCQVTLSHRGPLAFGPNRFSAAISFHCLPELERMRLAYRGPRGPGFPPLMPRAPVRRWVRRGIIRAVGPPERFVGDEVLFAGGERLQPELIVWATGFKPALTHLQSLALTIDPASGRPRLNGFESAEQPGLYFLGLDGLRDFRSRFLRGIRLDAPLLASQIAGRYRSARVSCVPSPPQTTALPALVP